MNENDYPVKNTIQDPSEPMVSKHSFSKYDLNMTWNAAKELVNHEWHMEEFHGTSCKCVGLEYADFEEWFNNNMTPTSA